MTTTFDPQTARHLYPPAESLIRERAERHHQLGLENPEQFAPFDAFAADLARGAVELTAIHTEPYAMLNLVGQDQHFLGLYEPGTGPNSPATTGRFAFGRRMSRNAGFCPHVIDRRGKALVLEDVRAFPRFKGNPVVDRYRIRTYVGAPLVDPSDGLIIGTVCLVGPEPRPWGDDGLAYIKDKAHQAMNLILDNART
ncbi:GAF domain-containing protein [Streptomyces sp. NPDC102274]|uniref:GAF domain-containing protein n=1 Tax=Streptomyces sp. NPDC102274 TaxID=3366151 RepID=UPI0037F7234C